MAMGGGKIQKCRKVAARRARLEKSEREREGEKQRNWVKRKRGWGGAVPEGTEKGKTIKAILGK